MHLVRTLATSEILGHNYVLATSIEEASDVRDQALRESRLAVSARETRSHLEVVRRPRATPLWTAHIDP